MRDPWKKIMGNVRKSGRHKLSNMHNTQQHAIAITEQDLKDIFQQQQCKCFWLGIDIDLDLIFESYHPLAPSVDRLDNTKGYTKNNIVICCRLMNLGRGKFSYREYTNIVNQIQNQLIASKILDILKTIDKMRLA